MPTFAVAQTGNGFGSCVNLTRDMSLGSRDGYTDGAVTVLQKFLSVNPTPTAPYLVTNDFGFYGTQTEAAVKKFQEDQGLPTVGVVGPLTRAKINDVSCGGTTTTPGQNTFSVSTPTGTAPFSADFTFLANQPQTSYSVDFGDGSVSTSITPCPQAGTCSGGSANVSHTYTTAGTYTARLIDGSNNTLGTTGVTVTAVSATATTALLTFNGSTNVQNVDPLASGTWSWTSANADIATATAVITGCKDPASNVVINPWLPWAVAGTNGTSASGSIAEIPGSARSGCTINATYSVTNSATGAHANATATVQFKTLLQGDIPPVLGAQCFNLQYDMTLNSTDSGSNGEVSKLQAFLQSTKSAAGSVYLTGEPTGYFGQLTKAAAIQFQTDNNLLAAGFVGPITRAKIKELTCTGTGTAGITVTAPNGGEQWQEGDTNTVTWTPYSRNPDVNPSSDVSAYLEVKDASGNFVNYGQIQESGKASIHWVTGELNSASQGGNFAPAGGGYYIRVVNNVTGAWDRSDAPFTLLPRPIVLKVNGSESWVSIADVNEPITLSWTTVPGVASCYLNGMKNIPSSTVQPNNGSVSGLISYESVQGGISYGVSLQCAQTVSGASVPAIAYAKFSVASIPQIPVTLTVAKPNGGEQIQISQPYTINIAHSGLTSISMALYKNDQWAQWLTKDSAPVDLLQWTPSASDIASGDRGQNIFKIYVTGQKADGSGYIDDKSDAPFSIVAGGTTPSGQCTDLQNNMDYRSTDSETNGEVSLLQFFLQAVTTPFGAPYLTVEPTGYYGQITRAAVVQFQQDNGLAMVGNVGPLTRAKIKAFSCGGTSQGFSATPTSGSAPLNVVFTASASNVTSSYIDFGDGTSGSQWQLWMDGGGSSFITHGYASAGTYTAKLQRQIVCVTTPCDPQTLGTVTVTVTGGASQGFSVTPTSGSAPLKVKFTSGVGNNIDFGDGTSESFVYCQAIGCPTQGFEIEHTYNSAGKYTALAKIGTDQTVGTATITATSGGTSGGQCTILTSDLSVGSTDATTGGDVTLLQKHLVSATSPTTGSPYLTVDVTDYGWFGKLTEKAVKQYQSDNGITNSGIIGPITRAKIKDMSCGSVPPANAPVVSLTASPSALTCTDSACSNSRAAIGWNVRNASMCVATGGAGWDGYAPNGSWQNTLSSGGGNSTGDINVSPTATSTYQLACTNSSSNTPATGSATISVSPAPGVCSLEQELQKCAGGDYAARIGKNCTWEVCPYNPNPTTKVPVVSSFSADATSVSYGGSTKLRWDVTPSSASGTVCTLATNGGTGKSILTKDDFATGSLTATTVYKLTCSTNSGTPASKEVSVSIGTRPGPLVEYLSQSNSNSGDFTISWKASNADSCVISYSSDGRNFTEWATGTSGNNLPSVWQSTTGGGVGYGHWMQPFFNPGTYTIRARCTGNGTVDKEIIHTVAWDPGDTTGGD
jgi:peptidoglycan hydrolase-like protein with peptidoglycan-binding domain